LDWDDVLPIYKNNILQWNNITYGIPYDGDNISLYYRKDIFENKTYKEKFFKKYNYELKVPKTWKEYMDIAKFFNNWDWDNDGKVEYGNAGLRLKGDVSLLQFFAFAGAYAKCPEDNSYYFDVKTMDARINTEGFIRALDEYIELIKYGPVGMKTFAGHDVRDGFVKGDVAMAIDWTDLGIMAANSPYSIVSDKIGFALLPGSDEVYSCNKKQWIKKYNAPSSISGNWTIMVSNKSKNKELAFEFASFIASKDKTKEYITNPKTAINPSRYSQLEDLDLWTKAGFSKESAKGYVETIKKSLDNEDVIVDILIPGGAKYYEILDHYVYEAIEGKMSSKEALESAAREWNKLTDSLGREKQKQYYRDSLNIK
jgi:multiple sugar transport system substrate-binding protein